MKLDKNCTCCLQAYGNYAVGKESEVFNAQTVVPIMENKAIKSPKGLCAFCNPQSEIWYTARMKCHA